MISSGGSPTRRPPSSSPIAFRGDRHHGRKFIAFGPDGKLYVNVGAPCNVCEPDPSALREHHADECRTAAASRSSRRASAIRVGFDWDPRTHDFWFTVNGRDMMGDDVPPDTLNHAPKPGLDFGFPYCHAGTIPDPEFGHEACV